MSLTMPEFATGLLHRDLPDALVVTLRRSFLDTMGVAAIGSRTQMAAAARAGARAVFGPGSGGAARVLMEGSALGVAGAAMAGAFTIDSIDAHDGTTPNKGHAGSAVFPAVLAVADAMDTPVTGADFAVWLALAYEVSYRAGQVQHATCPDYHTSGSWTAVGVAVAVARMLGCDAGQIRHAAGIGEYHGPRSQMMRCIDHPSMLRDGVGWGAPSGVTAAYLAREGFTGAPALTCEGGRGRAVLARVGRGLADHRPHPLQALSLLQVGASGDGRGAGSDGGARVDCGPGCFGRDPDVSLCDPAGGA